MSRIRRSTLPFDPDERLDEPPRPTGLVLDARLHLLDRQVLDADGEPVTTVDDVELRAAEGGEVVPGEPAVATELLSGPVLATRIFGGRPPASRWHRVPWRDVAEVGTVLRLGVRSGSLEVSWTERWVRDHVIGRIPGGRHAPD